MQSTQYEQLSFDERLSFLVEKEYLKRKTRRLATALRRAKLKQRASVEDIDFETARR